MKERLSMGFLSAATLTLVVAAAEIGLAINLIDSVMYSTLVLYALITTIICPIIGKLLLVKKPTAPILPEEERVL